MTLLSTTMTVRAGSKARKLSTSEAISTSRISERSDITRRTRKPKPSADCCGAAAGGSISSASPDQT